MQNKAQTKDKNEYKNGNILLVTSEPHWSLRDAGNDLVGEWIHMQGAGVTQCRLQ